MEPLDGPPPSAVGSGPNKFAEPVSLSSTAFDDLSLAGSAFELGFDLLGSRARRKKESRGRASSDQGPPNTSRPQFAEIQLSTFPQQGVQLVDNAGPARRRLESAPCTCEPRRSPAASRPSSGRSSSGSTSGSAASPSVSTAARRSSSEPWLASSCSCS